MTIREHGRRKSKKMNQSHEYTAFINKLRNNNKVLSESSALK